MNEHALGRRNFLKTITAASAVGLPVASMLGSSLASPAYAAERAGYDPLANMDLTVTEVDMRKNAAGRMLKARIYQPKGPGPFPTMIDFHGGAWNAKDRTAEEPMDRAIAASGVLVVAIDMSWAKEAPYPACVQDANYGVRWLKTKAKTWNGDPSRIGVYGSSSGGHVAELLCMRPHDPRYSTIPLDEKSTVDASISFAAMRSPISNPFARYENPENLKSEGMVKNTTTFFNPWETIHEANPQEILSRGETITLVPMLIMCGALDNNVLPEIHKKFAASYRAANGDLEFQIFEDSVHEWVATPGPQTTRAQKMVKAWIGVQLLKS